MTEKELEFELSAVSAGYEVVRDGWPDFLLVKGDEIVAVEVKNDKEYLNSRGYRTTKHGTQKCLHINQVRMLKLLEKVGLKVRIAFGDVNTLYTIDEYLNLCGYRVKVGSPKTGDETTKVLKIA
jgi:hypothetical protein